MHHVLYDLIPQLITNICVIWQPQYDLQTDKTDLIDSQAWSSINSDLKDNQSGDLLSFIIFRAFGFVLTAESIGEHDKIHGTSLAADMHGFTILTPEGSWKHPCGHPRKLQLCDKILRNHIKEQIPSKMDRKKIKRKAVYLG